ncbi:MAG TPA: hypothetical protein PK602_02310 [Methanothrix sp.]|nr:hypothetical protein [Methanothrix sp.]HQQ36913.1 hypothetical protein [Methanothrix sp.]
MKTGCWVIEDEIYHLNLILLIKGGGHQPGVSQPLDHLGWSLSPAGSVLKSSMLRRLLSGIYSRSSPRLTSSVRIRRAMPSRPLLD